MQRSRRLRSTCSTMPPRCSGARPSSARAKACAKCVFSMTWCSCSVSIMTTFAAASPASVSINVRSTSGMRVLRHGAPERGEEHVHVDGLCHVVGGAGLQALVAIADHCLGGHGDDRQRLVAVELADDAHGVEAVQA